LIFTSALPSKAFKTLFARVLNAPQLLQASTTTTPPSDGGASAFVFAAFFGSLSFFAEALRFGAMATWGWESVSRGAARARLCS
jgi:hypothetical protein